MSVPVQAKRQEPLAKGRRLTLVPFVRVVSLLFLTSASPLEARVYAPPSGYRAPVVAKVQIVFSMVSHYNHIADRVNFYNTKGIPAGNLNYAVPHIVYEPLVTLHNPLGEELQLAGTKAPRVRIWDPPVGFRFKKNQDYLRSDYVMGFVGLARLQIANEANAAARKMFTLQFGTLNETGTPVQEFTLPAGQSLVFAPWVEPNWNWNLETVGGYAPRAFDDWDTNHNFTNMDPRSALSATGGFGFHCVPGWDTRAGFQTNHLSSGYNRPPASRYDFEIASNWTGGAPSIKLDDSVSVECRAQRMVTDSQAADFQVDLMMTRATDPARDVIRELKFNLSSLRQPPSNGAGSPTASRTFTIADILQTPHDFTPGGKTPFAVLTAIAKPGALMDGSLEQFATLDASSLYDLRFDPVNSFEDIAAIGNLTPVPDFPTICQTIRSGDTFTVSFAAPPEMTSWIVMGGSSPDGFPDDLTSRTILTTDPTETHLHTAHIDVSGLGPSYFIRLGGTAASPALDAE